MESLTADFLFLFDEVHDFVIASQEYVKYWDKLSYPKVMRGLVYGIASLQTRYLAGESLWAKQFKQMVHTNIESTLSRIEKWVYATVWKSIVTNIIDTYLWNKENCKMFISLFWE
jgi:Na+/H+-dicarboxylate symporter